MPALAIWTPEDGVLGAVAPLGLGAAARDAALVVDLDPAGPAYPGAGSLAALVADGPRRPDLVPERAGMAVLRNGGVEPEAAAGLIEALTVSWPRVVLRLPACPRPHAPPAPLVPVRPLLPAGVFPWDGTPAVYQRTGWRVPAPGPGPVLPRPRPGAWATLLAGAIPAADRWVAAWREVWRHPWG